MVFRADSQPRYFLTHNIREGGLAKPASAAHKGAGNRLSWTTTCNLSAEYDICAELNVAESAGRGGRGE